MSLTIVVQGPVYQWTEEFIRRYKALPCVSEVILSTWKEETLAPLIGVNQKIKVVQSDKPENQGKGNRNTQIVSSYAGLKEVQTKNALKVRSDLFLPELEDMLKFYYKERKNENVFVLSMYPRFPFHPRDYVLLGETEDVKEVFDIPLDKEAGKYDEWNDVRSETYIGMFYYRKYHNALFRYIDCSHDYLTDNSKFRKDALDLYHRMMREEKGFIPFPRFKIELPKHYPGGYPFNYLKNLYGEVYHGEFF